MGDGLDGDAVADLLRGWGAAVRRAADGAEAERVRVPGVMAVDEWTAETAGHVRRARGAGASLMSFGEVILDALPLPVIAVTGSAGKTSTCHLIASVLRARGDTVAMGEARAANAWPDHTLLDGRADGADVVVAELTSTHLAYMSGWSGPDLGVLTALWPDHLELHGSLTAYEDAKATLLDRADRVVVPMGCDLGERRGARWPVAAEFTVGGPVDGCGAWIVDGRVHCRTGRDRPADVIDQDAVPEWAHPQAVAAAAATGMAWGVTPRDIAAGLRSVVPPPHRMAEVGRRSGRVLVDDSACATPGKLIAALRRCPADATVLVVGGMRGIDGREVHAAPAERAALREAVQVANRSARLVVPFGEAAALLGGLDRAVEPQPDIAAAVATAWAASQPGDTILVSPMFPVSQEERREVPRLLLQGG